MDIKARGSDSEKLLLLRIQADSGRGEQGHRQGLGHRRENRRDAPFKRHGQAGGEVPRRSHQRRLALCEEGSTAPRRSLKSFIPEQAWRDALLRRVFIDERATRPGSGHPSALRYSNRT